MSCAPATLPSTTALVATPLDCLDVVGELGTACALQARPSETQAPTTPAEPRQPLDAGGIRPRVGTASPLANGGAAPGSADEGATPESPDGGTKPESADEGATPESPDGTVNGVDPGDPVVPGHGRLHIVPWPDPVADPLGLHPCSRYVELYWLGILGPSTTWLLRRLAYGLEANQEGFDLDLVDTARSLGLGPHMGKNSPFRRALRRLTTFDLARTWTPGQLAVRTRIPPLPLRYLDRLPEPLRRSHQLWRNDQVRSASS